MTYSLLVVDNDNEALDGKSLRFGERPQAASAPAGHIFHYA
jgi:hypothetical protein